MIDNIEISWFKPFSHLEKIELSPLTIVCGKNNVGKTSFLEALFLILDRRNPELLLRSLGWRGFSGVTGPPERIFSHAFHDYDLSRPILIRYQHQGDTLELRVEFVREYFDRTASTDLDFSTSSKDRTDRGELTESDALKITVNRIEDRENRTIIENHIISIHDGKLVRRNQNGHDLLPLPSSKYLGLRVKTSATEDAEAFGQLEIASDTKPLIKSIREFFPEIRSLQSLPVAGGPMIYADVGLPQKVPVPALGDGAARVISYYLAAHSVKDGGLLLLDEVGAGLHHSQLPRLWELLTELTRVYSCQIIATTHSYEVLQAARGASEKAVFGTNEMTVLRLEQDHGSKEIHAIRYTTDEFTTALEHEWEIR